MNSKETQFHLALKDLTPSNNGIKVGELKLTYGYVRGILAYTNSACFFLSYEQGKKLTIYDINPNARSYTKIKECLLISELRSTIDDAYEESGGGPDAWVEKMKDVMDYDSVENQVEVGTHLYVDGKLEVGDTGGSAGDIVVGHELIIDDLQKIVDTNGYPFIPSPSGHMNEVLTHVTTGYTWKKAYELKGFQVIAKSVFEDEYVYQTGIVYFVWNDTDGEHYGEVYVRYYEH